MPQQLEADSQASLSSLVSGIVQDAQDLMRQQLTLFQVELRKDWRQTTAALIPMVSGVLVALAGLIALAAAGAILLDTIWPQLTLWGSFAVIGGGLLVIGAALICWGKSRFDSNGPLPHESLEGLKENIQWKTKN